MADRRNIILLSILYAVIITVYGAVVYASGGAEGQEAITFRGDWLPRLVNFGILALFLFIVLRKPARDFFTSRTAEIKKAIEESKEAREQAIKALVDIEQKLKDGEAEAGRMVEDARVRGEKDKEALGEEGARIVQDIQAQAKSGIEMEVEKAKTALSVEASLLAIDLAEGTIKEKMDKKDHERIMKDYISGVGGKK